jgi:hypothetical protein
LSGTPFVGRRVIDRTGLAMLFYRVIIPFEDQGAVTDAE